MIFSQITNKRNNHFPVTVWWRLRWSRSSAYPSIFFFFFFGVGGAKSFAGAAIVLGLVRWIIFLAVPWGGFGFKVKLGTGLPVAMDGKKSAELMMAGRYSSPEHHTNSLKPDGNHIILRYSCYRERVLSVRTYLQLTILLHLPCTHFLIVHASSTWWLFTLGLWRTSFLVPHTRSVQKLHTMAALRWQSNNVNIILPQQEGPSTQS